MDDRPVNTAAAENEGFHGYVLENYDIPALEAFLETLPSV